MGWRTFVLGLWVGVGVSLGQVVAQPLAPVPVGEDALGAVERLAEEQLRRGRLTLALPAYERLLAGARSRQDRRLELVALLGLARTRLLGGAAVPAADLYTEAVALSRALADPAAEVRALGGLASSRFTQADYEAAERHGREALALAKASSDSRGEGLAEAALGAAAYGRGNYATALSHFQNALALARTVGDRQEEARHLVGVALVQGRLDRSTEAIALYQQGIALARETGDLQVLRSGHSGLGNVLRRLGRYDQAIEAYQAALPFARETGNREAVGQVLTSLANTYRARGDLERALTQYREALAIARELNNPLGEEVVLDSLGGLYREMGDYRQALDHFERSLAITRRIGNRADEIKVLTNLAELHAQQGIYERAIASLEASLAAARTARQRFAEAQALRYLGETHRLRGDDRQALVYARASLALMDELGRREEAGHLRLLIGQVLTVFGDPGSARQSLERAVATGRELGSRGLTARGLLALGDLEQNQGQASAALAQYRAALAIVQAPESRNDFFASQVLNHIGTLHEQRFEFDLARASYREATTADPKNGVAANNFIRSGQLLAAQLAEENRAEAGRFCAVSGPAADAIALGQCALALLQTGRPQEALPVSEQAVTRGRTTAERAYGLYLKGSILTALARPAQARAVFVRALAEQPPMSLEADIRLALGLLGGDRRQSDQARRLDPTIAQVSSVADLGGRDRRVGLAVRGPDGLPGVEQAYVPPIYRRLLIDGQPVLLMLDTGAAFTLLNEETRQRTGIRADGRTISVSYADGRREQLRGYRPRSIALPEESNRRLRPVSVLGGSGRENLLGRDLLVQMLPADWFREAAGR